MRFLELLLISGLVAGVGYFLQPLSSDPYQVTLSELRSSPGFSEILWLDARSANDYESDHVEDAVHLNEDAWEDGLEQFVEVWEPGRRVVVYCDDQACGSSQAVAERLRKELLIEKIFFLRGGWSVLKEQEDW
ncbi:rhodanese-like domain-containing protein [Puniceicoccus vermicola]|uniref:Rhodanese-like domain-containing protein n=1 Tax=Puniceicoccus vermicola TaxID=388746 RepID=A0A7X1B212_9BACT|nr:rhodanese-like domain-containing protein [Puniceicoccus vermicola]MBC2603088.1 rhodanese-like domain-containing protein [Puniceicoccus vermicola]